MVARRATALLCRRLGSRTPTAGGVAGLAERVFGGPGEAFALAR
jgi:amino acid transporter